MPGPTAFKFKAAKGFKIGGPKTKPAAPVAMFSSGRESPEMEEVPPPQKMALPRAGLAAALSSSPPLPVVDPAKEAGLAAAQRIADRIAQQISAGSAVSGGAVDPAQDPAPGASTTAPAAASAEDSAAAAADAAADALEAAEGSETSRGGYVFGRSYTRATLVPVAQEFLGLQSIDVYENLGMVGRGAFNKIYKAKHRQTGQIVALKAMQLAALEQSGQVQSDEGVPLEMMREMSILLSMRHPNIVTVHEVVVDPTQMFMVMELVDFDLGLLIEHMKVPFSEQQVKCLAVQLLSALAAVHEQFVLHRDLKQTNLLLDRNGVLKLCDFGLARRSGGGTCTPNVTSLWYRAPEILLGDSLYGSAVDMWSFGCILAEWLQRGEPLVQGTGDLDQINAIFKLLGTPSESSWPAFSSLKAVASGALAFVEMHTISLGADGKLEKIPKNNLRRKFPAEGYTPSVQPHLVSQHRTTALSESGYELLNAMLTCDPSKRATAAAALKHPWFAAEPLPTPLSRSEIRSLRRQRDEAISSGAHQQAIAQQRAQTASKVAAEHAAAIAESFKHRMMG